MEREPWIIVVTHGFFGKELLNSAKMILGEIKNAYGFALEHSMSPEDLYASIAEEVKEAPEGSVVFVDLFGGTPSNVALKLSKERNFKLISGVSLPMLIEFEMSRLQKDHSSAVEKCMDAAKSGVRDVVQEFENKEK